MYLLEKTLREIKPAYRDSKVKAKERLDSLVKPLGSLGKLEDTAIKIAGITGSLSNNVSKKCIIIMSADNGITDEGVSNSPQSVTAAQTINILKGIAGVGVLAKHASVDLKVVDMGINGDINYPGLVNKKIRRGTHNIAKGAAMSYEEAIQSIETGIEIVSDLANEGYNVLGTGEMGIGNTSTSSAVVMTLTGCNAEIAVGKGSGLTEEGFENKKRIIYKAIKTNNPNKENPIDVLSKVGGFDIGGMMGCYIGAAYHRIPILIDGFISAVAALLAYKLNPLIIDFLFLSHYSIEPGFNIVMDALNLTPFLDLHMRLGEGTGAALAFNIVEAANAIISEMATFDEVSINDDFLIDIR